MGVTNKNLKKSCTYQSSLNVVTSGVKKERKAWGFFCFWHSKLQERGLHEVWIYLDVECP